MSENGFIRKPNTLLSNPLWQTATGMQRRILDWTLEHAVYTETKLVKGVLLTRGQVLFTIGQIVVDEGFSRNIVQGAIYHFLGLSSRGEVTCNELHKIFRNDFRDDFRNQFTVLGILLEGFCLPLQKPIQKQNHNQFRNDSETTPSAYMYKDSEDGKTSSNKLEEALVRAGGNVDNSQARSQHSPQPPNSPFLQKKEKQQVSPSPSLFSQQEDAFDPEDALKFHKVVSEFRYRTGSSKNLGIAERDLTTWMAILTPEEFLKALAFYKKKEAEKMAIKKAINHPPGFLNKIVHTKMWQEEENILRAKKIEEEHLNRLRANGAI